MFTGIARATGKIKSKKQARSSVVFEIEKKSLILKIGDSVSVNGACLTVIKKNNTSFWIDVMPETLKKTNLGQLNAGSSVNLEPALKLNDSLSGHFVTGHVDNVSKVIKKEKTRRGEILTIKFPKKLKPFIAKKGSIAINGVSLTVASVSSNLCTIALIPFTARNTNLGALKKGDYVNIEIDIIARYLYNKV